MQTIEYHTFDKSNWGPGPWQDEPDKKQWLDSETKLPCLIVRNGGGAWCGYVGVGREHPCYRQHYDDCPGDVHGGLTFAGHCQPDRESTGICHRVEPGEPDDVWWLGFDCHHWNDFAPAHLIDLNKALYSAGLEIRHHLDCEIYRDQAYVEAEVTSLAKQLSQS